MKCPYCGIDHITKLTPRLKKELEKLGNELYIERVEGMKR